MGSDEWLRYDPDMGMFDISYSAAFGLGRQLALQRTSYAKALCAFRNNNKAEANGRMQHFQMAEKFGLDTAGDFAGRNGFEKNIKEQMLARVKQTVEELRKGMEDNGGEDI